MQCAYCIHELLEGWNFCPECGQRVSLEIKAEDPELEQDRMLKEARRLRPGDEVFWTDPDQGICSRYIAIASIEIVGNVVSIVDVNGSHLDCFVNELSEMPCEA